jgi:rubrerythrin
MEKFSMREVVEQAIQTAKLGNEFYTKMSARFESDAKLKKLFDSLALKELEHEKIFTGLKGKLGEEKVDNWDEAALYMRAVVESEFFLGNNKSLPSLEHLQSIDDAVKFAMGFEKETLLYFYGLRDLVKDHEVFNVIIEEEKSHLRWLSDFRKKL